MHVVLKCTRTTPISCFTNNTVTTSDDSAHWLLVFSSAAFHPAPAPTGPSENHRRTDVFVFFADRRLDSFTMFERQKEYSV